MSSWALWGPNDGTAPLNQSGCAVLLSLRKETRRGQWGQSLGGSGAFDLLAARTAIASRLIRTDAAASPRRHLAWQEAPAPTSRDRRRARKRAEMKLASGMGAFSSRAALKARPTSL